MREQSIWSFSQCLLAEAETLSLLKSSSTTSTNVGTPVKLKQIDGNGGIETRPKQATSGGGGKPGKGQSPSMADQPRNVLPQRHRLQSWQKLQMVNNRCWLCGSKEHRKSDCKVKGNGKPSSGDTGFKGGRGGQNANAKAAVKNALVSGNRGSDVSKTTATVEQTFSSTNTDGPVLGAESDPQGSLSSSTVEVE